MISKKKALYGAIVLVLVTCIFTFTLTNIVTIARSNVMMSDSGFTNIRNIFGNTIDLLKGDTVVITKNDYDYYNYTYKTHNKLFQLEKYIDSNFLNETDDEQILDGQIKGMFESLEDPYSQYMTKDEFKNFMEHTKGTYGGIGIIVTPGKDNLITVVAPIEDTPGEKVGIKSGDKIVKVDGTEFYAENMDEAIKHMKGKPGTEVVLSILRKDDEGNNKIFDVSVVRQEIRLKSVKSRMLENNIGYIRIIQFDELVYEDFTKHLKNLQTQDMKGLIIDLRNNPGGLLDKCVEIADELIGESLIVYTETKNGEKEEDYSDSKKIDIPYILLVNEGSASASEILAGAVKDTESGLLIGTKTFGKGIVQRIRQLSDGSGFKLTVSKYFTPNGISIHGIGITPNITLEIPKDVEQIGPDNLKQDTQLNKAIEILLSDIKK